MQAEKAITQSPQFKRQIELEEECMGLGADQYRKARENSNESDMVVGRKLIAKGVEEVSNSIQEWLDTIENNKAGGGAVRNGSIAKFLRLFDPEVAALSAMKVAVDSMTALTPLSTAAINVAKMLETQLDHQSLEDYDKSSYLAALRKAQDRPYYQQRKVFERIMDINELERVRMSEQERCKLGRFLLDKVAKHTGLIEVRKDQNEQSKSDIYRVMPTTEGHEWLEGAHDKAERMYPMTMPMVYPPKRWTNPYNGGYWTGTMRSLHPMVIRRNERRAYLKELSQQHMPDVYTALNAMQETPWQINREVLEVVQWCWNRDMSIGDLPSRDPMPLPAKPVDIETNEEARREWRHKAAQVHSYNGQMVSKRVATQRILWIAGRLMDEDRVYFPHQLDWRSRAYPMPPLLNPQASDLAKGMLRFAEGKRLGATGAWWLYVHIANLFGVDKVPYEERVQWVVDNEALLLDSADNPCSGQMYWAEADDPWQALAACFELRGFKANGQDHVSHIPIAVDGTCSGLQHFSALLRDEVGGRAVNLRPGSTPEDIYRRVADKVNEKLQQEADDPKSNDAAIAQQWVGKVDRKICKRPTMTQPYGVTQWGMVDQIRDELSIEDGQEAAKHAKVLAKFIHEAIASVVVSAREAMDWLRDMAKQAADGDLPIWWETPTGFLVSHSYWESKMRRIDAAFAGVRIATSVREDTDKINRAAMARGIAPNFIHSMDASHMLMVTKTMAEEGYWSFAMVHDSFGVHACDVDRLQRCIRRQFVQMYSIYGLSEFWDQVRDQMPEKLVSKVPEMPTAGNLDLDEVLESPYFFS